MLNTMMYDFEFPYGTTSKYGTNVIADNMYSKVYSEVLLHSVLDVILDFSKDTNSIQKGK